MFVFSDCFFYYHCLVCQLPVLGEIKFIIIKAPEMNLTSFFGCRSFVVLTNLCAKIVPKVCSDYSVLINIFYEFVTEINASNDLVIKC